MHRLRCWCKLKYILNNIKHHILTKSSTDFAYSFGSFFSNLSLFLIQGLDHHIDNFFQITFIYITIIFEFILFICLDFWILLLLLLYFNCVCLDCHLFQSLWQVCQKRLSFFLISPACITGFQVCQSNLGQQFHFHFFFQSIILHCFSFIFQVIQNRVNQEKQLFSLYSFEYLM